MGLTENIKTFSAKCVRVWHILRKPDLQEFKKISKIASVGVLLIGLVGFIISVIITWF